MTWKERAKRARLTNDYIADALGYSNRAKVSQAWGWEKTPAAIRLLIVVAERVNPLTLNELCAAIRDDD